MNFDKYIKYQWTREEMAANQRPEKLMLNHLIYSVQEIVHLTYERRVFCFGAGQIGYAFAEVVGEYDFNATNLIFVDNDIKKQNTKIMVGGNKVINIISRKRMLELFSESDYVVFTMNLNSALEEMRSLLDIHPDKYGKRKFDNIFYFNRVYTRVGKIDLYKGKCPICNKDTYFTVLGNKSIPRYDCMCLSCQSAPRQRALVHAIECFFPLWGNSIIHESSPSPNSAITEYLKNRCTNYFESQYFHGVPSGEYVEYEGNKIMCQDLGNMSFEDESMDLFITQDVFEHIMKPEQAFREIARVLRKGGAHIFTIPWFSEYKMTRCRAKEIDGEIKYLESAMYHGNPVDKTGSLVTNDWGQDLIDFIYQSSGMRTMVYLFENKEMGLEGEFLEVFISYK